MIIVAVVATVACFAVRSAAAGMGSPHSFAPFESEVLPQWLARFKLGTATGHYKYMAEIPVATLYGSADALTVSFTTGLLEEMSPTQRLAWAAHLQSFQNSSGFFKLQPFELCGFQPWHATGYASSAFLLLGQHAAYPNALYHAIASNRSRWNATFEPLLHPDGSAGCFDVHSCAHKLVAVPAVLLMEKGYERGEWADFMDFWFGAVEANIDAQTGEVCPPSEAASQWDCLGAGMAFHSLYTFENKSWPAARAVLDFALAQQRPSHLWGNPQDLALGNWLNMDGAYQAARASEALGGLRVDDVEAACDGYLAVAASVLNNETAVLGPGAALSTDTHVLPGVVSAVAECGRAFPHLVHTLREWRVSTDTGPYP